MVKVYNDYLNKDEHKKILDVLDSDGIAWYKSSVVVDKSGDNKGVDCQLVHSVYEANNVQSEWWDLFVPLYKKLNILIFHRIKINCSFKKNKLKMLGDYHYDYQPNNVVLKEMKIAIYYVNTTNGQTFIKEDGKIIKIDCKANSLVTFPNTLEHTGSTHTDKDFRYVVNFNYI